MRSISNWCSSPPTTQVYGNLKKSYEKNWSLITNNPNLARIFTNAHIVAHRKDKSLKGWQCTSYWCYVIGTGPPSPRSKLSFLSFCDQNPWKDIKSSIVFLEFVSMDDLTWVNLSWSNRVIDFRAVGWLLKEPFFQIGFTRQDKI